MLGLVFFGAPLAYTALNLYLLAKIQPFPITIIPQTLSERSGSPERVTA
ncbi:MAG TPA: hypothetical protein VIW01_03350 [Dehalococcoidia bacterium]